MGGKLAGKGDLGLSLGAGALGDRLGLPLARQIALVPGDAGGGNGTDQQDRQGRHGDPAPPPQLMVLTDVLANQIVLGNPSNWGGDTGNGVAKARIAPVEARLGFGPTQIEPERLLGEDAGKAARQCGADLPVEVASGIVPRQLAVRLDQEDSLVWLVRAPERYFLVDPRRVRCVDRGEQDEPVRGRQRPLDRGPESRVRRQGRLVAKDPK